MLLMYLLILDRVGPSPYSVNSSFVSMPMKERFSVYTTQLRMPDNVHLKARVLAAYKNVSLNAFVVEAVEEKIRRYEERNGELPALPEEDI